MVCVKGPLFQKGTSHLQSYVDYKNYYEEEFVRECKKHAVYERDRYFIDPPKEREQVAGEKRLQEFEDIIYNRYKCKPHKFQKGFIQAATKGLAEMIVGPEDWIKVGAMIKKQRGWKEISKMVMGKAPRRFGKSVSVGMIVIALALVVSWAVQSIFSTGRRASRNLLQIAYNRLCDLGLQNRVERFNQEELFIRDPLTGNVAKIYCYPSNSKIDESFFILFKQTSVQFQPHF